MDQVGTYVFILPLILVQAAGWRRPVRSSWLVGLPFGTALGVLYSVTTISGPPLAILFNNQGLVKNEFRAGLALVRVVESSVTALVYYQLGLFIARARASCWCSFRALWLDYRLARISSEDWMRKRSGGMYEL